MRNISAPIKLCLGITNKCNLSCKHCLASSSRDNSDLGTDELLSIIKEIEKLKVFSVYIFGGEPLIRKDFFTVLDALSKLKIELSLNTNATLITKNIAKKLAQYPIKCYTVSLDGSCPKVQDPLRGRGSFSKNIEGIKNLIYKKCNVLISTTVTRLNYKDIENIVLLGKKLNVRHVRFNEVMYIGNAACFHSSLVMTVKEKFELLDKIKVLRKRFGGFISGSILQILDIIEQIKQNPKERFPLQVCPCLAGTQKCAIRPDGWVTPCEILWDLKAGNLKDKGLYDIWHNSLVLKMFRETMEIKAEEIPECKDCQYLRLCYKGHRCQPYYYPGAKFEHKELYCWRQDVVGAG